MCLLAGIFFNTLVNINSGTERKKIVSMDHSEIWTGNRFVILAANLIRYNLQYSNYITKNHIMRFTRNVEIQVIALVV